MKPLGRLFVSLGPLLAGITLTACLSQPPAGDFTGTQPAARVPVTAIIGTPAGGLRSASPDPDQVVPSSSASPSPSVQAVQVTAATASTPAGEAQVAPALAQVIASDDWLGLGLSPVRRQAWEDFADRGVLLPASEQELLQVFLEQYQLLAQLREQQTIPSGSRVNLKVREFDTAGGKAGLSVYAIDQELTNRESDERLFLYAYDRSGQARALLRAPLIQGLRQRISEDGSYVEYLTPSGEWLVRADARILDQEKEFDATLDELLVEENLDSDFIDAKTYPRFRFNLPGISSGFYAVEKLTFNQIQLLLSTLELFEREDLADLKPFVFLPENEVAYVITRDSRPVAAAAALTLKDEPREAIVLLFSKILFDNRYITAAALSHEAAHIWQGKTPGCDDPERMLEREIGLQKIPAGMLDWSGTQLFRSVIDAQIGSYQVSMWVSDKFNQEEMVKWTRSVIESGTNRGESLLLCR